MCQHMRDTCHVSGTMPIKFVVKFYPILTSHLYLKGSRSCKIMCTLHVCSLIGSKVRNYQKHRTLNHTKKKTHVRHIMDMCHVSDTMPIGFPVELFHILTSHTCLYLKGIRSYKITCKSRVDM